MKGSETEDGALMGEERTMCRHCRRIVERPEEGPLVHQFMELVAARISSRVGRPVRADDISIRFEVENKGEDDMEALVRMRQIVADMPPL